VAIERARVARYRVIMDDEQQRRIQELKLHMGSLQEEMRARRKAARKRGVDVSDLQAALAAAKAEFGPLIEQRKASSAARHDERRAALSALQEKYYSRIKRARQAASRMGLFWGTYNDIVQRVDAGKKHGGELHFRKFRGEGTLTAQIMGGMSVDRVNGGHQFFQLDPPTEGQKWRHARMRIGSNADRSPVWVEVPIVYHRDLPDDANIRSVSVSRRVVCGKPQWQVNDTVNVPCAQPKTTGSAVAIDLGWRLLPEGVRVAYWLNESGHHGELLIPCRDIAAAARVAELRAVCDRTRDETLPAIASWLAGRELPDEWNVESSHLTQWRSTDKLAALIRWWSDHRLDGDDEIYSQARKWRTKYLHLSNWWRNLQTKITGRMRERFRLFALHIAKEYAVLVIEDFDLREVIQAPKSESDKLAPRNHYRQLVSPGLFRSILVQTCNREGVAVARIDASYTTRECHICHYKGEWDALPSVMHRCAQCGNLFDQDHNAAVNLLRVWLNSARAIKEASA